jgi:hypothetical protein
VVNTWALTVRHELDVEWMECLVEMAGYGIGYWATKAEQGAADEHTYTVWWDDSGTHRKCLSYGALARAVQRILDPEDGAGLGSNARAAVAAAVLDPGDIDADVADVVVQVAALGKIVYG